DRRRADLGAGLRCPRSLYPPAV
ncbi:Methionine ABC transporter ATP-binding protein, partial [Pseudomonas sp. FEN]